MKFELSNHKNFKNAMSVAELMIDEVRLECDRDGVRFRGLDRSHIAFINMEIGKDYFEEYEIGQPETCVFDTSEIVKVLKRIKSDDKLIFKSDDENVTLQFIGESKRTFNIRQIDILYDSPALPNMTYPCSINIEYDKFNESIKDCELYDTKLKATINKEALTISSTGDLGEYLSEILITEDINEEYSSIFSIDWLKNFLKMGKMGDNEINIRLGNNMPIQLRFDDDEFKTEFMLAPRIEEG